jgi:hypothetical protein
MLQVVLIAVIIVRSARTVHSLVSPYLKGMNLIIPMQGYFSNDSFVRQYALNVGPGAGS